MHKILGIVLLVNALVYAVCGIVSCILIERSWGRSRERRLNPDLERPSSDYVRNRKIGGAILFIMAGVCVFFAIIQFSVSFTSGAPLSIEGSEMKFPCTYSDIQAMGYELVEGQEIVEIQGTDNSFNRKGETYNVVNDKGQEFQIRFENNTPESKLATDCYVYEMTFEYAAPKNPYGSVSTNSYLYNSQLQEMGMSSDEIEEFTNDMNQRAEDFEEYNKPMNSPRITLDNGVTSSMSEADVKAIMKEGQKGTYSQSYYSTRKYVMKYGDERILVTITFVDKNTIAKITLEY